LIGIKARLAVYCARPLTGYSRPSLIDLPSGELRCV
jgi:hypothetical protein